MRAVGIVAEYNPFHLGHAHQTEVLRRMGFDTIIAVMSPSVVQRGEVAMFPLDVRVKAALGAGVDLIVCIPAPFAIMSAEGFARAGVEILAALGGVQAIAFGSEVGDISEIINTKNALSGTKFKQILAIKLATGMEFAKARAIAAAEVYPNAEEILRHPNNILGVEYCRAISELEADLTPIALTRVGAGHDDSIHSGNMQSASALRKLVIQHDKSAFNNGVPPICVSIYNKAVANGEISDSAKFDTAVLSRLRSLTLEDMAKIRGTNEGLEYRLYNAVQKSTTLDQLYTTLKCRRYSHARMRRLVLDAALGYTNDMVKRVPYVHILGANEKGIEIIKLATAFGAKPISSSLSTLLKLGGDCERVAIAHSNAEDFAALCLTVSRGCSTAFTSFMIKDLH